MTPNDSEPPNNNGDTSSTSPPRKRPTGKWTTTPEALNKLLESLSPNPDEAAKEYVALINKLSRFFERHHCDSADTLVDDVIELVTRKIDEGQQIENVSAYAHRVALYKYWETLKQPERVEIDWEHIPAPDQKADLNDEDQKLQDCFDICLAKLPGEIRDLILTYYREKEHAKIELRKTLAAKLSIPMNALRIRAHRIRVALEECIEECLSRHALGEM